MVLLLLFYVVCLFCFIIGVRIVFCFVLSFCVCFSTVTLQATLKETFFANLLLLFDDFFFTALNDHIDLFWNIQEFFLFAYSFAFAILSIILYSYFKMSLIFFVCVCFLGWGDFFCFFVFTMRNVCVFALKYTDSQGFSKTFFFSFFLPFFFV